MKFTIPEQFCILGYTIQVTIDPSLEPESWGQASLEGGCSIRLSPKLLDQNPMFQAHVFLHEVLHVLLDAFGSKLSEDEAFVDMLSGLLAQAFFSARGSVALHRDILRAPLDLDEMDRKHREDKPDPGKGYKLLPLGEVVQRRDEVFLLRGGVPGTGRWVQTRNPGSVVTGSLFYRREV